MEKNVILQIKTFFCNNKFSYCNNYTFGCGKLKETTHFITTTIATTTPTEKTGKSSCFPQQENFEKWFFLKSKWISKHVRRIENDSPLMFQFGFFSLSVQRNDDVERWWKHFHILFCLCLKIFNYFFFRRNDW